MRPSFVSVALVAVACTAPSNGKPLIDQPPAIVSRADHCSDPFAGEGPLRFKTDGWKTNFCRKSVPFRELRGGGPPRDGIPPIDRPKFVSVEAADAWLGDREPVIALEINGAARAYPLQILMWHEIANDTLGGQPIAVTFCPLCYAAIVFARPEHEGERLTFGTSGNLRHSDLVMWDRQTESWWQQFSGHAIVGQLTGSVLEQLPASLIAWVDFKRSYPGGDVLSRETGHRRDYGRNPYAGYDSIDKKPFLYEGKIDGRWPPMEYVVGVIRDGAKAAYARSELREKPAVNDTVGQTPIAVLWRPGGASAMNDADIAQGADIGVTGVFDRRLEGRTLTFEPAGKPAGHFRDRETGTLWNILGKAVSGPLAGKALTPLAHHNVFWFAWSAFVL